MRSYYSYHNPSWWSRYWPSTYYTSYYNSTYSPSWWGGWNWPTYSSYNNWYRPYYNSYPTRSWLGVEKRGGVWKEHVRVTYPDGHSYTYWRELSFAKWAGGSYSKGALKSPYFWKSKKYLWDKWWPLYKDGRGSELSTTAWYFLKAHASEFGKGPLNKYWDDYYYTRTTPYYRSGSYYSTGYTSGRSYYSRPSYSGH